jgi:trigger factor
LQIEQQETENRELKLKVQVDEARVQEQMRKTARQLAKRLRVPGFRPGKAPFHVVQRWVGPEALRGEAVDALTEDLYREAIDQADVSPFAPGSLDDIEMDPLVLHLTIPLEPTVDLGDYRQVRVDPPTVEVEDKQVDEAMKAIQEKHALLEPADRPAQEGDVVIADLVATQGGEVTLDREGAELLLDPETLYPDIPFVENVVGMSAGEEKEFDITVSETPEDEEEGEPAEWTTTYSVTVHEVKSRYLPPLTDDLAREEGDYETLLELRMATRKNLTDVAQRRADAEYVDQVFDQMLEGATIVYPPAAVELELDRMIEEMEARFKQQGWTLDDLLKIQGKTVEMQREEMRPQAEEQLKRSQTTIALVRAERLSMEESELDQLVEERMGEMGEIDEELKNQLREYYNSGQGRMFMANDMLMTKFTERVKAIGRGEAPDLAELSSDEEE